MMTPEEQVMSFESELERLIDKYREVIPMFSHQAITARYIMGTLSVVDALFVYMDRYERGLGFKLPDGSILLKSEEDKRNVRSGGEGGGETDGASEGDNGGESA